VIRTERAAAVRREMIWFFLSQLGRDQRADVVGVNAGDNGTRLRRRQEACERR
jgi:hypothetical protein